MAGAKSIRSNVHGPRSAFEAQLEPTRAPTAASSFWILKLDGSPLIQVVFKLQRHSNMARGLSLAVAVMLVIGMAHSMRGPTEISSLEAGKLETQARARAKSEKERSRQPDWGFQA